MFTLGLLMLVMAVAQWVVPAVRGFSKESGRKEQEDSIPSMLAAVTIMASAHH